MDVDSADTPSLYSHSVFSPQTVHLHSPLPSSGFGTLNDLAVSMLDMDDDRRSSFHSGVYEPANTSLDQESDPEDDPDVEDSRMSYLGPKMRYHTKAPWEVGAALKEEEEEENTTESQAYLTSSTNRFKTGIVRHLPFGGVKSGRSSEESTTSRKQVKVSLDSSSSQSSHSRDAYNRLYTTSQGISFHGGSQTPVFTSISHPQTHTPSPSQISPASPRSSLPFFSETTSSSIPHVNDFSTETSGSFELDSKPPFSYSVEETHPYANPDLACSSSNESTTFHPHDQRGSSPTKPIDTATTGADSKSYPHPPVSIDRAPSSPRLQSFKNQGKEISAPVLIRGSPWKSADSSGTDNSLPPPHFPGWNDRASSPAFNLISLEEARAQRSRSITCSSQHLPASNASVLSSNSSNVFPFPEDTTNGQSPSGHISRGRARSVSAGVRAKQALNNIVTSTTTKTERQDSEHTLSGSTTNGQPGGRMLKNKRSGFLRLFNGAKDDKSPPPPVPSLSDGFAAFNANQAIGPNNNKLNSRRIPVPQISPTLPESVSYSSEGNYLSAKSNSTPKRIPPPPLFLQGHNKVTNSVRGEAFSEVPLSAPAHLSQFPALKLRPLSSAFSAQFGDHILPRSPEPETPSSVTSASAAISPITPGLYGRPDNCTVSSSENLPSSCSEGEDDSTVVRRIQEQISRTRLAFQQQVWELEGQVRDLKVDLESERQKSTFVRDGPYCDKCGRGKRSEENVSIVNRPRARTGTGQSRFGSTT
ncbi:hypothetical protein E1B28_000941 [Marasmius oreades]|uniref:Uncharacterized protein n=1 Tax=Marasmius oreades TaxID=181124 RepID=A0A9P7V2D1_9AGAR|nr:uncharacterized protein E1B28_000941 [Marasmius oreades]KAG7099066.1 hypothetical protein E1B28_000941 [Marasmius oreades]